MTTDGKAPVPEVVRRKSPGRVAACKRLHTLGLASMGGRRPTTGRKALAELVKRGEQVGFDDAIAQMHREHTEAYIADCGGPGNVSNMDLGLIRRQVVLDIDLSLLLSMRDKAGTMSREKLLALSNALKGNMAAYAQLVKTLGGPGRRPVQTSGEIVVRRFQEENPKEGEQA